MRKAVGMLLLLACVMAAVPAFAELQNVTISGDIRIRGNFYTSPAVADNPRGRNPLIDPLWFTPSGTGTPYVRWLAGDVALRPIGRYSLNGIGSIVSPFSWSDDGHAAKYVEQRTRLGVKADFTDNVSAFIELDSYDIWSEDFRSNYITGADGITATNDDLEVYQAYIDVKDMFGTPVSMRVGRQEISLGSGWLVGTNDTNSGFTGLSFDAIRLTYAADPFTVDAFWAKLDENSPWEEDGDIDLYGIYGSYKGFEDITLDAYWLLVRDATMYSDVNGNWLWEQLEKISGVDDYDAVMLHTIGLRGAGKWNALDFEAELAYQFGNAGQIGGSFRPWGLNFGDDDEDFSTWGANLEVGYTFDITWQPRVYLGTAYFDGEDNRDVDFFEWVSASFWTFHEPKASLSFNRLFSNWEYSQFLDNTALSNAWILRGGVSAKPMEKLDVLLAISYFKTVEEFSHPPYFWFFGQRVVLPLPTFITNDNDGDLGWEVGLYATYNYTEDLCFKTGWAHLFTGDGLEEGNFNQSNGLLFNGGVDSDDADYVFVETEIKF